MKTSDLAITLTAALVLGLAAFPVVGTTTQPPAAAEPPPAAEVSESIFDGTAIGVVLRANGNEIPKNGTELVKALAKVGEFGQLPVPFSAVALETGLTHPRVVIAPRPAHLVSEEGVVGLSTKPEVPLPGGLGLPQPPMLTATANPISPISTAAVTKPSLEGRLFFAANLEPGPDGKPRVKTIEFISWNFRKKKFDFGVIECSEKEPEIRVVDGVRCFSCHKNKGPILGQGPWSNTTNNDNLRAAVLREFNADATQTNTVLRSPLGGWHSATHNADIPRVRRNFTFDGISLVVPDPEICDAAVRQGGDLARDREVFRLMSKTGDGRRGLVVLLSAIATPGQLEVNGLTAKRELDQTFNQSDSQFATEWAKLQKNVSSTLADFSPSGSMGTLKSVTTQEPVGWGSGSVQRTNTMLVWGGNPDKIKEYDNRRAAGEHGMPSNRQPSNPKAFLRPDSVPPPPRPSAAVSPVTLARVLGITEGDRAFFAKALGDTAEKINKPKVTAATLAREVFAGPTFAAALTDLPDREEFKDRFVAALAEVARKHKLAEPVKFDRKDYASGPQITGAAEELQPAVVPTTACLACHDIRGVGKPGFNPIPQLAFDPFDKQSREAWAKTSDPKKRAGVLNRMLTRLATDKDMPPEDSAEYEVFRQKDPAAFDAVKDWLEAELKK